MENEQITIGFGDVRLALVIEFKEIEEKKFHIRFILLMDNLNLNGLEFDLDLNSDSTVTGEHRLVKGALVREGIPEA
jgi:hypothetical protein